MAARPTVFAQRRAVIAGLAVSRSQSEVARDTDVSRKAVHRWTELYAEG